MVEHDDGFMSRHGPFQSSLNEGKNKRAKKPGILRGIGHMFRFGKHRKDGIAAVNDTFDANSTMNMSVASKSANRDKSMTMSNGMSSRLKPPNYNPPPPVAVGIPVSSNGIHQGDVFNHRYSHYVNYDELQQQIRYGKCILNEKPPNEQ